MFDVIIAAGGKGLRAGIDKLSVALGESTVIARTVSAFRGFDCIKSIIVATDADYSLDNVITVPAGKTRAESVKNGLNAATEEYVLIHDGARPFVSRNLIAKIMSDTLIYSSSVPFLPITDSLRRLKNGEALTVDRNDYITLQTPQGYLKREIELALTDRDGSLSYDESELFSARIRPVHLTEGEPTNKKITNPFDLLGYNLRIGSGFDVHRLEKNGKALVLSGIRVPFDNGTVAHSDGDVIIHALMNALLSAINERDIGVHFPDTDSRYENADSAELLKEVMKKLYSANVKINNVTLTVIAQRPKLNSYIPLMQARLEELLNVPSGSVSISATTAEGLGLIGEGRAIACFAAVSVY